MTSPYDVIIVGGGPVGLAQALALLRFQRGLRVALVDRRPFTVPLDRRAFALSAGVRRVLDALDVWADLASDAQPISAMKITDSGAGDLSRPVYLSFLGDVAPGEPYAHMVPNRVLTRVLLDAVGAEAEIVAPVSIAAFDGSGPRARLDLADGRVLEAPLVIGADGAQSFLRASTGIGVTGHDYGQHGIVSTISHSLPHEGVAFEHFLPTGPFASLPLPGTAEHPHRSSLVWTVPTARAAELKAMSPDEAARQIEEAMGASLGAVTLEEPLQSFPLKLQLARSFVGPRLALIGDAAHVIHPLAGQGLNLGLKDVAALTEAVLGAARLGLDHGSDEVLGAYERWRRFDTSLLGVVTDGLNTLFSNESAPLRAIRDVGLGLVDRLQPVKGALIGRAAGIEHTGPKLLRGLPL